MADAESAQAAPAQSGCVGPRRCWRGRCPTKVPETPGTRLRKESLHRDCHRRLQPGFGRAKMLHCGAASAGMPERLPAIAPLQREPEALGNEGLMDVMAQSSGMGQSGSAGHSLFLP